MNRLLQSSIIALALTSPAVSYGGSTWQTIKDTTRLGVTASTVIAASYLVGTYHDNHLYTLASLVASYSVGKISSYCVYTMATDIYGNEIHHITHNTYDQESLRAVMKQDIINKGVCSSSPYRNYPLLYYYERLCWYIDALRTLRLFDLGTEQNEEIKKVISALRKAKKVIITDYDFIKERRDWDNHQR